MNNLNEIQKKEIEIKQHRLKTLLDIDKLVASATVDVDTDKIINYSAGEKSSLVLDIVSSLNIDDFDEFFTDVDGSKVRCSIESDISHILIHPDNIVEASVYSEFVSALATYDIEDLADYGIINSYLELIKTVSLCYDEICLSDCAKI